MPRLTLRHVCVLLLTGFVLLAAQTGTWAAPPGEAGYQTIPTITPGGPATTDSTPGAGLPDGLSQSDVAPSIPPSNLLLLGGLPFGCIALFLAIILVVLGFFAWVNRRQRDRRRS